MGGLSLRQCCLVDDFQILIFLCWPCIKFCQEKVVVDHSCGLKYLGFCGCSNPELRLDRGNHDRCRCTCQANPISSVICRRRISEKIEDSQIRQNAFILFDGRSCVRTLLQTVFCTDGSHGYSLVRLSFGKLVQNWFENHSVTQMMTVLLARFAENGLWPMFCLCLYVF